jgi:hypothetical protein
MACGSSTAKSHDMCTVVFLYTLIYDRMQQKYGYLRPYMGKIRSLTVSIFRRISSYTVTDIYDRNTITCFMAKYGRIRSFTTVYRVRNRRPGKEADYLNSKEHYHGKLYDRDEGSRDSRSDLMDCLKRMQQPK